MTRLHTPSPSPSTSKKKLLPALHHFAFPPLPPSKRPAPTKMQLYYIRTFDFALQWLTHSRLLASVAGGRDAVVASSAQRLLCLPEHSQRRGAGFRQTVLATVNRVGAQLGARESLLNSQSDKQSD